MEPVLACAIGLMVGFVSGFVMALRKYAKPTVTHEDVETAMLRAERRLERRMDAAITRKSEEF